TTRAAWNQGEVKRCIAHFLSNDERGHALYAARRPPVRWNLTAIVDGEDDEVPPRSHRLETFVDLCCRRGAAADQSDRRVFGSVAAVRRCGISRTSLSICAEPCAAPESA